MNSQARISLDISLDDVAPPALHSFAALLAKAMVCLFLLPLSQSYAVVNSENFMAITANASSTLQQKEQKMSVNSASTNDVLVVTPPHSNHIVYYSSFFDLPPHLRSSSVATCYATLDLQKKIDAIIKWRKINSTEVH